MILRHLLNALAVLAGKQVVSPAVADVHDVRPAAGNYRGYAGRAHYGALRLLTRRVYHGTVRRGDRGYQEIPHGIAVHHLGKSPKNAL